MADAARYHRLQRRLSLLGFVVSAAYLLALLFTPEGRVFARWSAGAAASRWAQVGLVTVVLVGVHTALTFPLGLIRGYWLPKRFGLLHQPLGGWLMDRVKAALIGSALGLAAIEMVYALLALTPLWWLWTSAVFFVAQVALAAVLPIWIAPLFYRLTPLADARLGERLLAVARRAGVEAIGVFVADQSRKSRTANAAVVGLGRTRQIVLFDTLLSDFPPEEIESVLAHELGHHVHGDVRRGLLVNGGVRLVTFWLAALALDAGVPLFGLDGRADPAGLPWLALVLVALAPRPASARQRVLALARAAGRRLRAGHDRRRAGVHRRDGAAGPAQPRRAEPQPLPGARVLLASGAGAADRARPRKPRVTTAPRAAAAR